MYAGSGRQGLGAAIGVSPILSITPSPIPAGPGQQVLTVRGTGLALGFNLGIVPADDRAITNPTIQGYGGPLYAVSADGTSAKVVVDFRGNVTQWHARLIDPSTYQTSPWFDLVTVAGAVTPLNMNDYALQSAQSTPLLVLATTQLVASRNAAGQPTNHVILTGGQADVPQVGGGSRSQSFPGPGLLVPQDGGTWQFVPAAQAKALVEQRFGVGIIPQCVGSAVGRDLVDPFGLPIVTPQCPGSISWVDTQGNAVTSPWSTGAVPQPGSPIVTVRPSSGPAPAVVPYTGPPSVIYQTLPAVQAGASPTPAPTPQPLYQSPGTTPGPAVPVVASPAGPAPLYQSADSNSPAVSRETAPPSAPATGSSGWIIAGLVAVGLGAVVAGRKKSSRRRDWS